MTGITLVKIGTMRSAITAMCRPMEITCVQPKFSSFDQMSFTRMGFTAKGSGACLGGAKNSLRRVPKPPKPAPQATASLLLTGRFAAGLELKKSPRLLSGPLPKEVCVKGASLRSRTLMGRSKKNCLRFDQKSLGARMAGRTNLGTAEEGTETAGCWPAGDTFCTIVLVGRKSMN